MSMWIQVVMDLRPGPGRATAVEAMEMAVVETAAVVALSPRAAVAALSRRAAVQEDPVRLLRLHPSSSTSRL
ncbi:MAG TPA: hypothetical protein VHI54_02675 [Actinomycetota bacterium]|nr:hypothetical protein [Actinomycetota bacterium]